MSKNIITILFLLVSMTKALAVDCEIRGTISNAEGRSVYLISYPENTYLYRDSAVIKDGKFVMTVKSVPADRWGLSVANTQTTLVTFIEDGVVNVSGDAAHPETIIAHGTKANDAYAEYYKYEVVLNKKRIQWFEKNAKATEQEKEELRKERQGLEAEMRDLRAQYAEKNKDNMCGLVLMGLDINNLPYKEIDEIIASLPEANKDNEIVRGAMRNSQIQKTSAVGLPAPEIVAKDANGNEVSLSSLRGKWVLIDFWASWCHPCRKEIPNVKAEYEKYKDKGFTVLAVSIDSRESDWKKALAVENMPWLNVIDAGGKAAAKYNVTSIPHTVLIDKDGVIRYKKLRGARLSVELEKIFR